MIKIYSIKDLELSSGLSYSILRNLRDKGYFKEAYMENHTYFYTQNDYDKLMFDVNFSNNSYTTTEAEIVLGKFTNNQARILIEKYNFIENIDYICFRGCHYFNKSRIDNLTPNSITIDLSKYISVAECNKNISNENYIYDGIRLGYITDTVLNNKQNKYISLDEFKKVKRELYIIENSYTKADIAQLLEVSFCDISMIKLNKFPYVKIRKRNYYDKLSIDNCLNKYSSLKDAYTKHFSRAYKVKNITFTDIPIVDFIPDGYISTSEMIEKYGYSRDVFSESMKTGRLTNVVRYKRVIYFDCNEFEKKLKIFNNSIPIKDIKDDIFAKTGAVIPSSTKSFFKLFPTIFLSDFLGLKHYRVPLKDYETFMKNEFDTYKIDLLAINEDDPHKLYDLLIGNLANCPYKLTISKYNEFSYATLNSSRTRTKRNLAYMLYASLNEFIELLHCDFYKLTDEELEPIILKLNSRGKLYISNFLNYTKKLESSLCAYVKHYNRYVEVDVDSNEDNFYSEQEWFTYLSYISNIDIHIRKAFNNASYARRWLYVFLHFIAGWRKSDFLNLPSLDILDIEKYDITWFENNEFTMIDAQYIINNTKLVFDNIVANKNLVKNHFVVYPCLTIPLAISIIAAEKHRRKSNTKFLIGKLSSSKSDFRKYFDNNLDGFTSQKANRTLLTYVFTESAAKEGYSAISYSLSSTIRSHKVNKNGISPTTEQYIYSTNKDGDAKKIAFQLHQRGIFGWLYKAIIDLAYDTSEFTVVDTTNSIIKLKEQVPVETLEGISEFIEMNSLKCNSVITELKGMSKPNLKELIHKLQNGKLPSKINHTSCIKSNNCPYKTNTQCYRCRYSIPTIYTLLIISSHLIDLLDKLDNCDINDTNERIFYSHHIIDLLKVINEAKQDFCDFDISNKEYINTFLEIKKIKDKFDKVKLDKLLLK